MIIYSSYRFCFFVQLLCDRPVLKTWFLNAFKSPVNFCHSAWNIRNLSLREKLIILKQSFKVLISHLIKHGLLYNNPLWDEENPYHFRESLCSQNWTRLYLPICMFCYYGVCFFCKNTEKNQVHHLHRQALLSLHWLVLTYCLVFALPSSSCSTALSSSQNTALQALREGRKKGMKHLGGTGLQARGSSAVKLM